MNNPTEDAEWERLRTAIGEFIMRFTLIESVAIPMLIRALGTDNVMIEYAAELLTLEQEMMLIRRLCDHYQADSDLIDELKAAFKDLRPLQEFRNEIAHNAAITNMVGELRSVGVHRPYRKRPLPTFPINDAKDTMRWFESCVHSSADIEKRTAEAGALFTRLSTLGPRLQSLPKPIGRLFRLEKPPSDAKT